MNVFDAIEFHKMRKFLASKLRTIVQCTGNSYLANSSRKMAIVVVSVIHVNSVPRITRT